MLEKLLTTNYFDLLLYIPAFLFAIIVVSFSIFWAIKIFTSKNSDEQKSTGYILVMLAFSYILIVTFAARGLNQQAKAIDQIKNGRIENYYNFKKKDQIIEITAKSSDLLKQNATVKIIGEDKNSYQIQYQDAFDYVPKSSVE